MLSLRDPVVNHNNNSNGNNISHANGNGSSSATTPAFPQFRIRSENGVGQVNGQGTNGRALVKHEDTEKIQFSSDIVKPASEHEAVRGGRLARPSDLYINGPGSGAGDYSFMSSCSLPSGQNTPSTPEVTLRQRRSVTNNATESGRHLNSALARHFRRLQCGGSGGGEEGRGGHLSHNLHSYLRDVFHQLDSSHTGAITR